MAEPDDVKAGGAWKGKTPCWVLRGCITQACRDCIAYRDQSRLCWEHEGTLCAKLLGASTCFACDVYRRYAGGPTARRKGPAR